MPLSRTEASSLTTWLAVAIRSRLTRDGSAAAGLILVACLASASTGCFAPQTVAPAFESGAYRPVNLVVLPPQASYTKKAALKDRVKGRWNRKLAQAALQVVSADLGHRGHQIKTLTEQDFGQDPELADLVDWIDSSYNAASPRGTWHAHKMLRESQVLAEGAPRLSAQLGVDAVVVVRTEAVGITAGRDIVDTFFEDDDDDPSDEPGSSYVWISLSVIEGVGGTLIGYFEAQEDTTLEELSERPRRALRKALRKALENYPWAKGES